MPKICLCMCAGCMSSAGYSTHCKSKECSQTTKPPRPSTPPRRRGNCYVTSEALFHLLGGKSQGWVAMHVVHQGESHWFLMNRKTKQIVDPTQKQFLSPVPYHKAKGMGFLTKKPSKRAVALMEKMLWQEKTFFTPVQLVDIKCEPIDRMLCVDTFVITWKIASGFENYRI